MKNDYVWMDTDDVSMTKAYRRIRLLLPFFVYSFLGPVVSPDAPSFEWCIVIIFHFILFCKNDLWV